MFLFVLKIIVNVRIISFVPKNRLFNKIVLCYRFSSSFERFVILFITQYTVHTLKFDNIKFDFLSLEKFQIQMIKFLNSILQVTLFEETLTFKFLNFSFFINSLRAHIVLVIHLTDVAACRALTGSFFWWGGGGALK